MAFAYDWIKGLIESAADATSDNLHKILLGDSTNSPVRFPAAWAKSSKVRERGSLWGQILFPAVLGKVGEELDTHGISWAYISTNGAGVAPTITCGNKITNVSKSEGGASITPIFTVPYTGANDFVCFSVLDGILSHQILSGRNASYVTLVYFDNAGLVVPINDKEICFAAIGLR